MADKHMGVAEVKRNFADVVGEVLHGGKRVIVERRGRPVVAIVPLTEKAASLRPGQQLAAAIGSGKQEGESFRQLMKEIILQRQKRRPRKSAERSR
jgi:prevent-host-death family protein